MKYSIVMPYYKRPELRFSLESFSRYYSGRGDLEILLIEDSKNFDSNIHHEELLSIVKNFESTLDIKIHTDPIVSYNPSTKYNLGVRNASGTTLILTNPETPHMMDILGILDKENIADYYLVCSCLAVFMVQNSGSLFNSTFREHMWYQHSKHRDVRYHFCSVISKENYLKIGGFDERYTRGIAYDDDNFVRRVLRGGLPIISRDDLLTYHIEHSRDYSLSHEEYQRLVKLNNELWAYQLASGDF